MNSEMIHLSQLNIYIFNFFNISLKILYLVIILKLVVLIKKKLYVKWIEGAISLR